MWPPPNHQPSWFYQAEPRKSENNCKAKQKEGYQQSRCSRWRRVRAWGYPLFFIGTRFWARTTADQAQQPYPKKGHLHQEEFEHCHTCRWKRISGRNVPCWGGARVGEPIKSIIWRIREQRAWPEQNSLQFWSTSRYISIQLSCNNQTWDK